MFCFAILFNNLLFWILFLFFRFSEKRLDKTLKTSWAKKMQMKAEKKSIKSFEKQLKEDRNKQLEVRTFAIL